jgi:hypothetical protein
MTIDHTGLTYPKAMVAGATAGVMEHICMFPVDTAKTRMQSSLFAPVSQRGSNVIFVLSDVCMTTRHHAAMHHPHITSIQHEIQ